MSEPHVEKQKPVPPFVQFCCAAVPMVFDDSLSYYEALCAMWKYLDETVKVINNNALVTEDFIAKVNELHEYVEHYFDNLDVQQEIDNKLDEMVVDGTLRSIINDDLFSEINNRVTQNSVDIEANTEAIQGKVTQNEPNSVTMTMLNQDVREALTGGSTAVVCEDAISTVNITDGAVTFFKLDNYLQSNKFVNYSVEMDLGDKSTGIAVENSGTHKVEILSPSNTTYGWYKVALTKGKYYVFSGYDYYSCRGLIIADSSDNVIWTSDTSTSSNVLTSITKVFRANDNGMYVYLDVFNNILNGKNWYGRNCPSLREMDSIYNIYAELEPLKIRTIEGAYTSRNHWTQNLPVGTELPSIDNYANTNIEVYAMVKGAKYRLSCYSWSDVCGYYVLGLDNTIIAQANTESAGSTYVLKTTEFTAQTDGYITLIKYTNNEAYNPSIEILNQVPSASTEKVSFSRWIALGDSLTEVNSKASTNYVGYIAEELGIEAINLGHSGAGYMHTYNDKNFRTEVAEISGYNYNTDVITVMGSINDFNHLGADYGELGDTGTDTLYGCMYTFFNSLQTRFVGTRLGVISLPTTGENLGTFKTNAAKYMKALKETAELFSVPVLDLTLDCNLKPYVEAFRNEFYDADGIGGSGVDAVHPNSKGHWMIHDRIKEFLKTL